MSIYDNLTKPIFYNGKITIYDKINCENRTQKIGTVKVKIEYPETRLGTVEIMSVLLFDKNNTLLYRDNDIINKSTYFNISDIKKEIIDK